MKDKYHGVAGFLEAKPGKEEILVNELNLLTKL
jgi:hypothetical protein